jgi:hypothetical protein
MNSERTISEFDRSFTMQSAMRRANWHSPETLLPSHRTTYLCKAWPASPRERFSVALIASIKSEIKAR